MIVCRSTYSARLTAPRKCKARQTFDRTVAPIYAEIAGMLLEASAKAGIRDEDGKTALDYARDYRLDELVRLLEGAGD